MLFFRLFLCVFSLLACSIDCHSMIDKEYKPFYEKKENKDLYNLYKEIEQEIFKNYYYNKQINISLSKDFYNKHSGFLFCFQIQDMILNEYHMNEDYNTYIKQHYGNKTKHSKLDILYKSKNNNQNIENKESKQPSEPSIVLDLINLNNNNKENDSFSGDNIEIPNKHNEY